MKRLENTSLRPFHTFAVDVHAKQIIEAHSKEDFVQIWHEQASEPKLILGEGSNILFYEDFAGTVILNRLKGITNIETDSHWLLHVAAGENWHQFILWCLEHEILGLENLALIPGVVGSAPIQNIGAYGKEFQMFCDYVDLLMLETGETKRLTKQECQFGYRESIFKHDLKDRAVVLAVGFKIAKDWQPNIEYGPLASLAEHIDLTDKVQAAKAILAKVCAVRQQKLPDPSQIGNAGSFFKNPVVTKAAALALKARYPEIPSYPVDDEQTKLAAGWLIEQAGLKGYQLGGAAVHDKQALVLINKANATAQDVVALAHVIMDTVLQKFAVELHPEVRLWGNTQELGWNR